MFRVRIISEKDILEKNLLDIHECVKQIEEMFRIMADGDYQMSGSNGNSHGARLVFNREGDKKNNNIFISMPAYLGGKIQCAGVKWHGPNVAGSSDAETKHTLILNDCKTGIPIGIMAANTMTTYRTSAVSVYATKMLAKRSSSIMGIIGPGKINTIFTEGILREFERIKQIKVKGRGKENIDRFIEKISSLFPDVKIQVVDSLEEAVKDVDIISVNTGFDYNNIRDMPIIREKWVKPGTVILCPSFIKFSDEFIVNKTVNVVDNIKMYESYAEELGYPVYRGLSNLGNRFMDLVHEGKMTMEDIIDLKDITVGSVVGRKNDDDIILFSSGGMGVEDIAVGYHVLKNAEQMNIGQIIEW